jgi:hypothetical protein
MTLGSSRIEETCNRRLRARLYSAVETGRGYSVESPSWPMMGLDREAISLGWPRVRAGPGPLPGCASRGHAVSAHINLLKFEGIQW